MESRAETTASGAGTATSGAEARTGRQSEARGGVQRGDSAATQTVCLFPASRHYDTISGLARALRALVEFTTRTTTCRRHAGLLEKSLMGRCPRSRAPRSGW